jgi:hypothetical protein
MRSFVALACGRPVVSTRISRVEIAVSSTGFSGVSLFEKLLVQFSEYFSVIFQTFTRVDFSGFVSVGVRVLRSFHSTYKDNKVFNKYFNSIDWGLV